MWQSKMFYMIGMLDMYVSLNVTRLMTHYISSCGEQTVCKEWPGMINYDPHPQLQRCSPCSCEESCFWTRTCCPDKFFGRKLAELRSPNLFLSDEDDDLQYPLYELITWCPDSADDHDRSMYEQSSESIFKGPVTSLDTNYSYLNEYCARCHGEDTKTTVAWDMSYGGNKQMNIFNFVDSFEMLKKVSQQFQVTVLYTPAKSIDPIVKRFYSSEFLPIPTCPWNEDLQIACSSSYVNIFRFHKNIFCYICSLSETVSNEEVRTERPSKNLTISRACTENPLSPLTMPYRNIYCIIWDNPPTLEPPYRSSQDGIMLYVFEDFSSFVYDKWKIGRKELFVIKFANISFHNHALLKTIEATNIRHRQNVSKDIDNLHNEKFRVHVANIIAISSGLYPWRLCDMDALPEVVQNVSIKNCDCSYSCLFRGKCTCCIDTALKHPIQCLNRIKIYSTNPSLNINELKFLTVSTCFQNRKGSADTLFFLKIKHLCEEPSHSFDLPVIEAGVTYKNIFCFLCNQKVENENEVILHDGYSIMNFNILCKDQLHFIHKINLQEILQEAKKQNCQVVLDTEKAVLCNEYSTDTVQTCYNDVTPESLRWGCENLKSQSFGPVQEYKNEFCKLCNQMGHFHIGEPHDERENNMKCIKSTQKHVQFENACDYLLNLTNHPFFYPYRNIFCSYCARGSSQKELVSQESCAPIFGGILRFKSTLIRDLFLPSERFSTATIGAGKNTEYDCFPGRVYERNGCRLLLPIQRGITYSLHLLSTVKVVSTSNNSIRVLHEIRNSVRAYLYTETRTMGGYLNTLYFIPKLPVTMKYKLGFYHLTLQVILHIHMTFSTNFDRDTVERQLLKFPQVLYLTEEITGNHSINFEIRGLRFANISETMTSTVMTVLPNEHSSFIRKIKGNLFDANFNILHVQDILFCRHRKIPPTNIIFDEQNNGIIVRDTQEIFRVGEFVMDFNKFIGVCDPSAPLAFTSESVLAERLEILTLSLNITSAVAMVILFVVYCLVPGLRTLPGLNTMSCLFSLICMQVTYTIANAFEKRTLRCALSGILLHYFWLSVCCSFFVCCFCFWKTFRAKLAKITNNNTKSFIRYSLFSYVTPLLIVGVNVTVVYLVSGEVGYGGKVCFVDNKISNIITFISPLSLTCLVNTIFFLHVIPKFRSDKGIRKSKKDASEVLIAFKLFSLTGSVWILQIVDGFLPEISVFSFITTVLTSTQGLFIFFSYATSPQIIKHIRSIWNT